MTTDRFDVKNKKNIYLDYEFIEKARKSIDFADIIVINHALLFSDLENETPILTNLKNIVIDEAHNIEDTVTDILKKRYNFKNFVEVLAKIEKILTIKDVNKLEFDRCLHLQYHISVHPTLNHGIVIHKELFSV